MVTKATKRTSVFIKKEKIGEGIYAFYFEKKAFSYIPGQYIQMTLEHKNPDSRGTSRFFTLAASPHEEYLLIVTFIPHEQEQRSSFKQKLFALKEGEAVVLFGPMGKFVFDESEFTS